LKEGERQAMNAIEVRNLSKQYKYFEKAEGLRGSVKALFSRETKIRKAVSDFTFSIGEGEFVGLMGPNGAGKSTIIKMLTGIIRPTSGSAAVFGYNPSKGENEFKKKIAVVMGQKSQLWWDLPASDSLLLNKSIYGVPEQRYRENVRYFTKLFEVEQYLNVPVRKLSLGERMKMDLIASLIHEPKMLFLDEPTIGLDAVAQRQIREMLKKAGEERGVSLLLTSHYTEDLLELTPRVIIIRSGEKVYDGDLSALLRKHSIHHTITAHFTTETAVPPMPEIEVLEQSSSKVTIRVTRERVQEYLKKILDLGNIEDICIEDDDVTLLVERVYKGI
jgi:ABC-2 type transport system ATP-binding protein